MKYFVDQKEAEVMFEKLAFASTRFRVIHVVAENKDAANRLSHDLQILLQNHKLIARPGKLSIVGGNNIPSRTLIFHSNRQLMRTNNRALKGIAESAIIRI